MFGGNCFRTFLRGLGELLGYVFFLVENLASGLVGAKVFVLCWIGFGDDFCKR